MKYQIIEFISSTKPIQKLQSSHLDKKIISNHRLVQSNPIAASPREPYKNVLVIDHLARKIFRRHLDSGWGTLKSEAITHRLPLLWFNAKHTPLRVQSSFVNINTQICLDFFVIPRAVALAKYVNKRTTQGSARDSFNKTLTCCDCGVNACKVVKTIMWQLHLHPPIIDSYRYIPALIINSWSRD